MTSGIGLLIKRTEVASETVSLTANARSSVRISNVVPSGSQVISITVNNAPNLDWVRTMAYMDGTTLVIRYHNEYSGAVSGTFGAVVYYI